MGLVVRLAAGAALARPLRHAVEQIQAWRILGTWGAAWAWCSMPWGTWRGKAGTWGAAPYPGDHAGRGGAARLDFLPENYVLLRNSRRFAAGRGDPWCCLSAWHWCAVGMLWDRSACAQTAGFSSTSERQSGACGAPRGECCAGAAAAACRGADPGLAHPGHLGRGLGMVLDAMGYVARQGGHMGRCPIPRGPCRTWWCCATRFPAGELRSPSEFAPLRCWPWGSVVLPVFI